MLNKARPPLDVITRRWNHRAWTAIVVLAIVLYLVTRTNGDPKIWFVHTLLWSLAAGAVCGALLGLSERLFNAASDLSAYSLWIIGFPPATLFLFVAEVTIRSNLAWMNAPAAIAMGLLSGSACGACLFLAAYAAMATGMHLADQF